jgi:hypothetical protein
VNFGRFLGPTNYFNRHSYCHYRFRTADFPHLSSKTKSTDMLYTTTWRDFFSFILPLLIIYYIVVLLKYYRQELLVYFLEKRKPLTAEEETAAMARVIKEQLGHLPAQPSLFDEQKERLVGLGGDDQGRQSPEMFKVMATVVAILKDVVAQGLAEKMEKEQLLTQIAEILSRYGQLKNTPYQASINSFLTRTCASNFSLVLEQGDLAALWG